MFGCPVMCVAAFAASQPFPKSAANHLEPSARRVAAEGLQFVVEWPLVAVRPTATRAGDSLDKTVPPSHVAAAVRAIPRPPRGMYLGLDPVAAHFSTAITWPTGSPTSARNRSASAAKYSTKPRPRR